MEESQKEDSPQTSKSEIINTNTTSSNLNIPINSLINNPEIEKKAIETKFETYIINAYKKLIGFKEKKAESQKTDKKAKNEIKDNKEEDLQKNINECEIELRKALEEIDSTENLSLNKNIIDKITRIYKRNKINLSLLIGEIYIKLMEKKNLFIGLNQKNKLDQNIIITFINELIKMNSLLKSTYIYIKYDNALFNFLENIIKEIAFNSEQLNEINKVLTEHKTKNDSIKLNTKTSKDFLKSINEAFNKQNNLYGQYKVVLDNSEEIVNLINSANLGSEEEVNNFLQ